MGHISISQITDGTTASASSVNGPLNTIAAEFNGNIDDSNIKAGAAIDNGKLAGGTTGMFGAPQSYTPSWTNVTQGSSPTNSGSYVQIGKVVYGSVSLTLGTGGSVSGAAIFTLPVTSVAVPAAADVPQIGYGGILISGVAYRAILLWDSTTQVKVRWLNPQLGSNNIDADTGASAPAAFGAGSVITGNFWYFAA